MKIGFWNLARKNLAKTAALFCREQNLDLFIVAESDLDEVEFLTSVNSPDRPTLSKTPLSNKVQFYSRFPRDCVVPLADEGDIAIRAVVPPIGQAFLIAALHLPSKLHASELDQTMLASRLRHLIERAEDKQGHRRTLVIGDFNMNPFEDGLVAADCLHAVMTRSIARRGQRTVKGQSRFYFYNPMWRYLGDREPRPPGSYFYASSKQISFNWNIFDQVLIRPDLLDHFHDDDVQLVNHVGGQSIALPNGAPDAAKYSDHFPVVVTLTIETDIT